MPVVFPGITVDFFTLDTGILQLVIQKQPGAGAKGPIGNANIGSHQIGNRLNFHWVGLADQQPLFAAAKVDHCGHFVEFLDNKVEVVLIFIFLKQVTGSHMALPLP